MKVTIVLLALSIMAICGVPAMADDMSMLSMPGGQMMMKQCMAEQKSMNSSMPMSDMKKTCEDKMSAMMKKCVDEQKSMNSSMSMTDMHKACDDKMMKMQH
jgi:hypothetical protein